MEEEDWLLVAALLKLLGGVSHQEGVAIVDWVAELEDEDGIGAHLLELGSELKRRLAVVVKTVVPLHACKRLDVTTGEPVSLLVDHFDVWVVLGVAAPGTGATLFLAVDVELGVAEDGEVLALVRQCDGLGAVEALLVLGGEGQDDGDGLIVGAIVEDGVEVERLEHLVLAHEPLQWSGPALGQDLVPFGVELGHLELGQAGGLLNLGIKLVGGDEQFLVMRLNEPKQRDVSVP